jgi:hypothetical protein
MKVNQGMKRVGDVLSVIFDEGTLSKAREYSRLFDFWAEAVKKNGIAAAADHSWIKELDRGILLVQTDHPGWKQLIQTKHGCILDDFRSAFPEFEISGMSIMLGYPVDRELKRDAQPNNAEPVLPQGQDGAASDKANELSSSAENAQELLGYDDIKNEALKESLKRLGKTIEESSR